ncbi:glycolate oxidase FAD binding subunit [Angulomicrobium tetraedrale]|uniref:Glycolate oxidase FAD binding subunit n=1 Tax=Ancylobacter tetraedralis TaxID=217068 RepID=A0A839Z4W0_9HYPH|nr:FAD-binding protein [Ancylobacter tetraedralis]MBB3770682.1 glycolate oxidase FAD binding subunit [Ancylobacter tetraedralis]
MSAATRAASAAISGDRLCPRDEADVAETVRWAASEGRTLDVAGRRSKAALGRAIQTDFTLELAALTGVTLYEPEELVLSARAGTPVAEIEALVAGANQMMAFEPMDFGPLLGQPPGEGTLGGLLACNLAGPRRPSAGAARDHALGIRAVSGRGEAFKAGGRVVKNVTGYDLPRGLAGSHGTFAAFTEITIKVLPRPETVETLLILGLDDDAAASAMSAAVGSYYDVSGAAHLPADVVSRLPAVAGAGRSVTALRLEGVQPSILHRRGKLEALLRARGELAFLDADASRAFWRALRDVEPFAAPLVSPLVSLRAGEVGAGSAAGEAIAASPSPVPLPGGEGEVAAIWRVSVAPMAGARIGAAVRAVGGRCFYDWSGGLVWIEMPGIEPHAPLIRPAVSATGGGHATLIRAGAPVRAAQEVFQPLDAVTGALVKRMKSGFDPAGVLSPGRMYAGM